MVDAEELAKSLNIDDVTEILMENGSGEPRKDGQGNWNFNTICHHGDSRKLRYYIDNQFFQCHTQCGTQSIYDVLMGANDWEFIDALRYVASFKGISLYKKRVGLQRQGEKNEDLDFLNIHLYELKKSEIVQLPRYDEKVLRMFSNYMPQEWENEGISEEVARTYGIKFCFSRGATIIPHYDKDNRLIGIRQRNHMRSQVDAGRKYIPTTIQGLTYKFPVNLHLYGLNRNKENIKRFKSAILFESEKSVMLYESYYKKENNICLATLGMNVSNYQRDLLLGCGIDEITIAFDKQYTNETVDNADKNSSEYKEYVRYIRNLIKITKMLDGFCNVYIVLSWGDELGYKDSPIDCGKEAWEELYRNRYLANVEELEELIK